MPIEKATREKLRLRAAILGATGSGKTCTSLIFAHALQERYGGKIGLIDTQNKQSLDYINTRYAPEGFDVFHLGSGDPLGYVNAINQFAKTAGEYSVLVIDSMSTAWQGPGGVLEKAGDDPDFKDWGPAKRPLMKLLDTIQKAPFHVLCTVLADTHYLIGSEVVNGKTKMTSVDVVGTKPIQDKKFMPFFSLQCSMDQYHTMTVVRTSFSPYDRAIVTKPDKEWLKPFMDWMDKGDVDLPEIQTVRAASVETLKTYYATAATFGLSPDETLKRFFQKYGTKPEDATEEFLAERLTELQAKARTSAVAIVTPKAKKGGEEPKTTSTVVEDFKRGEQERKDAQ